jgi:hypothetical protein
MEGPVMRYIYTIILSLIWGVATSQIISVPNTTTFTVGHVMRAVYGDSIPGRNSSTLFADSNAAYFDPSYGSKTMSPPIINGFRNYNGFFRSAEICDEFTRNNCAEGFHGDTAVYCLDYAYATSWHSQDSADFYAEYDFYEFDFGGGVYGLGQYYANYYGSCIPDVCTRPTGLSTISLAYVVNGTPIDNYQACMGYLLLPCGTCSEYTAQIALPFEEGTDVYLGTGTDCTRVPDGFYVIWQWCGPDCETWVGYQVIDGKLYFAPC